VAIGGRIVAPTGATIEVVRRLFAEAERGHVIDVLARECGANLPFCERCTGKQLERVRFAVLKLSEGDLDKLREAVQIAQIDSRDVLMAAGFGHSLGAHRTWSDSLKT
jgi:hypothetical protein